MPIITIFLNIFLSFQFTTEFFIFTKCKRPFSHVFCHEITKVIHLYLAVNISNGNTNKILMTFFIPNNNYIFHCFALLMTIIALPD